jgi:hypothetical protein
MTASAGLPARVPVYPGVQIQNFAGGDNGGSFSFNSPDSPSKVASKYEDKVKALGCSFVWKAIRTGDCATLAMFGARWTGRRNPRPRIARAGRGFSGPSHC